MPLPVIPSAVLQTEFVLLALLLGVWWVLVTGKVYVVPDSGTRWNMPKAMIGLGVILLWLGFLFGVSQQVWSHEFISFPPPALRVFLTLMVVTTVIAFSPIGRKLAEGLPLIWLVGFQAFRLPTELMIYQAAEAGLAPMEMTFHGRNFDIVSAILALLLVVLLRRGVVSSKLILGWNILGMVLLLNVIVTAIMSMPHPMQVLHTNPPNVWVTYFPFILLPGVAVCSALLGHLLVFRALTTYQLTQRAKTVER
ncbi:MAG: hypothetical protein FD173_1915 [Gallionellaceae bacterium]|nr:MAG: hypothetical protein FD173_1915 [Gallionellaceae bacterium]